MLIVIHVHHRRALKRKGHCLFADFSKGGVRLNVDPFLMVLGVIVDHDVAIARLKFRGAPGWDLYRVHRSYTLALHDMKHAFAPGIPVLTPLRTSDPPSLLMDLNIRHCNNE